MKYEFRLVNSIDYNSDIDDLLDEIMVIGTHNPEERTAELTIKKNWKEIIADSIKVWLLGEDLVDFKVYIEKALQLIGDIEKREISLYIDGDDYYNTRIIIEE